MMQIFEWNIYYILQMVCGLFIKMGEVLLNYVIIIIIISGVMG